MVRTRKATILLIANSPRHADRQPIAPVSLVEEDHSKKLVSGASPVRGFGGAQFNDAARSRSSSASCGATHRSNTTPHGHEDTRTGETPGMPRASLP